MLAELMRRLTATPLLALMALVVTAFGCGGTDGPPATTSSAVTSTTATDEALTALLLRPADLPDGFTASAQVDDTVTTFCAADDAAAGLRATARVVRGFAGDDSVSVIQLIFRFADDDAAQFVEQAEAVLNRCHGVPDLTGLAFEYDSLSPELTALLDRPDSAVGRHGVNVGSGSLSIDVVVVQQGDIAELIAVLAVDLPRAQLDALALQAIGAALDKL